jgi:pilus assembly protein TadC
MTRGDWSITDSLFFERLAVQFPFLEKSLVMARNQKTPARHVKESLFTSLMASAACSFLMLIIFSTFGIPAVFSLIIFLLLFSLFFYMFLFAPQYQAAKAKKLIEGEIVSAIRFLLLEIKTERSIYYAMINTSENFPVVGIYFDEIIGRVKLGKTLEQSLLEAVEYCPSQHLKTVYWQLLNSLQTGSDITSSLRVLLDNVVEEHKIGISAYGRELNAFSLFYMMVAIIIPTVGFTIVSALLTFIGFNITIYHMIALWLFLAVLQYSFLITATSRRPAVEAY